MELNERSFREWLVVILACISAIALGSTVVAWGTSEFALSGAFLAVLAWIIWARDNWWIPVFVGGTIGGVFLFSFKFFPTDVALGLAVIGLLPLLVIGRIDLFIKHRPALSLAFYLLPLYMIVRLVVDIHASPGGGAGNMTRVIANGLWPFVFGWLFYSYGKTSVVPRMIAAILGFATLRIITVYIGYLVGTAMYIPGINYIAGATTDSLADIRACSYFFLVNLFIVYQGTRNIFIKLFTMPLLVAALYLILSGGSRFETVSLILLPAAFALATRRWFFLLLVFIAGAMTFSLINLYPLALEKFPPAIDRALSSFILAQGVTEAQQKAESSDQWHHDLKREGFVRWSSSPETVIFGSNLQPYREESFPNVGGIRETALRVSHSADVGAYESGLWIVLGTLGITGYTLYLVLFVGLWRYTVPYLVHHRVTTLKDGIIFWGTYSSIFWYIGSDSAGGYPSMEVALMVVAAALVHDLDKQKQDTAQAPERYPRSTSAMLSTV